MSCDDNTLINSLSKISVIDGRYAEKCNKLQDFFSEEALINHRIKIELEWLKFFGKKFEFLNFDDIKILDNIKFPLCFEDLLRVKYFESISKHDVKAVEWFVKEKIQSLGNKSLCKHTELVHIGCTSEDINNLAYSRIIKSFYLEILRPEVVKTIKTLGSLAKIKCPMLSLTHGQPATPTTFGKEIALFACRLLKNVERLDLVKFNGKFNGAVGNFSAWKILYPNTDWVMIGEEFVSFLGLSYQPFSTQIEPHDDLIVFFDLLRLTNSILIGACQDLWQYISRGRLKLKQESKQTVGSSTMPHKLNPINFENAEGNFGLANALLIHYSSKLCISRFQRDLSDSTVMRTLGTAFGHSVVALKSFQKGIGEIDVNKCLMEAELNNHWEVLAEPLQTIMRINNVPNSYEQIQKLFQNKPSLNAEEFQVLLATLRKELEKNEQFEALKNLENIEVLTPFTYLGESLKITSYILALVENFT